MLILILALLSAGGSTEAAKRSSSRPRREISPLSGPSDEMIWDNGLIEKTVTSSLLIEKGRTYYEQTDVKKFKGQVLAYVTPWNDKGYELAVTFRHKLTHVSPVWYQLKKGEGDRFVLEGGHNVNKTWLTQLKEGGKGPRIVPRIILEVKNEDQVAFLGAAQQVLELILMEVQMQQYDGVVFEAWMQWSLMGGMNHEGFRKAAFSFLSALYGVMHMRDFNRELILAVPPLYPAHHKAAYTEYDHLLEMQKHVDGWSIMTYDYATAQGGPGPNAPLPWLNINIRVLTDLSMPQRTEPLKPATIPRLWLGLNFYGYDFVVPGAGGQAIVATQYLALLKAHVPSLAWDEETGEHSFEYTDATGSLHRVYFPTPRSVEERLELMASHGMGVSIWELGQGIERFMDLF